MDVKHTLNDQDNPSFFGKKRPRSAVDDSKEYNFLRKKSDTGGKVLAKADEVSEEDEKINSILEGGEEQEDLTDFSLNRLILKLEKRVSKNQEMRIKYADAPEKFLESEIEMNEAIQELHVLAASPELYSVFVDSGVVKTLLQILSHDNTDIALSVVDLLQELTEADTLVEAEDGGQQLVKTFTQNQFSSLLLQNLDRLDETIKEEANGVHATLAIFENVTEFDCSMCEEFASRGLIQWLLKRLWARVPFNTNKLYCSEILSILLQNHDKNRKLLGELDGIDVILQQLAVYKRTDPNGAEEEELMQNLFDCLCSCLMFSENRARFLRGEGVQLMNLMVKEKKMSRLSAIKVLNHAMTGPEGAENCSKFVSIFGLRSLFPLFMRIPNRGRKGFSVTEIEEHIVSILYSLLRNCGSAERDRVLTKFTENDFEKCERLLELHQEYVDRLKPPENKIAAEKKALRSRGVEITQEDEDSFYLRRLDHGLYVLQIVDCIILDVCLSKNTNIKSCISRILSMRNSSFHVIRIVLQEYVENISDHEDPKRALKERERMLNALDEL